MKFPADILARAEKIKLVIFDVDGVLTDGRLHFTPDGEEFKVFHVQDGFGIKLLLSQSIQVAVISGRNTVAVSKRMQKLGVTHVYQGHENKLPIFTQLLNELKVNAEQVAYVGDELIDIPIIKRVGLGIAVANAHSFVKQHANWQTHNSGGQGAVREVCDLILTAQAKLEVIYSLYLN